MSALRVYLQYIYHADDKYLVTRLLPTQFDAVEEKYSTNQQWTVLKKKNQHVPSKQSFS